MLHSTPNAPSHSRLKCLHHCSRQYYHKYVCEQEEDEILVLPLHLGKVMHAGLDSYYRGGDWEIALMEAWDNAGFYGDDAWCTYGHTLLRMKKYIAEDAGNWTPLLLHKDDILWENIVAHECKWDQDGNMILSESRLHVKLGVFSIEVICVPDLVLMHDFGEGNVPVVVDHKCRMGWINEKQRSEMEVGHQLRIQALVVEAITGLRCRDGWMNSIYVGENSVKPKSKAKMRELSMFGPWSHEQMAATWEWLQQGQEEALRYEKMAKEVVSMRVWPMNPGQHCHYCEFREECVGE